MDIDRVVVARLLRTKTSNVRKAWKDSEYAICVQIWNSKEKVYISLKDYNSFIEEIKNNPKSAQPENTTNGADNTKNDADNKNNFGVMLMVFGAVIILFAYTKDTTVSSDGVSLDGERVNNIGLISDKQNQIQVGGIFFISGIILYSLKNVNSSK